MLQSGERQFFKEDQTLWSEKGVASQADKPKLSTASLSFCLMSLSTINVIIYVRKNAALKESSREKSHVHRARFNGRPKLPGWPGKRWCSPEPGRAVAFIEGGW
jgi:hypothetical protein